MKSCLYVFLIIILSIFLGGWFVMLLWNQLMPVIFGLGTITYWQAIGLELLASLLVKGSANVKDTSKMGDYFEE